MRPEERWTRVIYPSQVGDWLTCWRTAARVSREQAGEAISKSPQAVGHYETGRSDVGFSEYRILVELYGVDAEKARVVWWAEQERRDLRDRGKLDPVPGRGFAVPDDPALVAVIKELILVEEDRLPEMEASVRQWRANYEAQQERQAGEHERGAV